MKEVLTEKIIPFIVRCSLNYLSCSQALHPNIWSYPPQAANVTILFPNTIQRKDHKLILRYVGVPWHTLSVWSSVCQQKQTVHNSGLPGHLSTERTILPKLHSVDRLYQEIWLRHSWKKTQLTHRRQVNVAFTGEICISKINRNYII